MRVNAAAIALQDVAITVRAQSDGMEQIIDRLERIEGLLSNHASAAPREYLSIDEAADFIGVSRQSLDRWRMEATGPTVHRVGRRVLYSVSDLRTFMDQHRSDSLD